MKNPLFGLAAFPLLASISWAAQPLNDGQMNQITAGSSLPSFFSMVCPSCQQSSSSSTATNGVTTGTGGALLTSSFDSFVAAFLAQLIANKFPQ